MNQSNSILDDFDPLSSSASSPPSLSPAPLPEKKADPLELLTSSFSQPAHSIQPKSTFLESTDKEDALADKFAVLFNPGTPRASPTNTPPPPAVPPISVPITAQPAALLLDADNDPLTSPGFGDFHSGTSPPTSATAATSMDMSFFDSFTHGAEQRTEERKSHVLEDELASPSTAHRKALSVEWDLDYFNSLPATQPITIKTSEPTPFADYSSPSSSPTSAKKPKLTRSPTFPTLAPPSISPSNSSSPLSDDMSASWHAEGSSLGRSTSYQTLSSISSKWLPEGTGTFRKGGKAAKRGSGGTLTDSIWGVGSGLIGHARSWTDSGSSSSTISGLPHTLDATTTLHHPNVGSVSSPSPFAAHGAGSSIFVAPGAPGFRGSSSYDWDKGYSEDLDRERSRPPSGPTKGKEREESVVEVITRKGGSVKLEGRKLSTSPILDVPLADEIRPSLPAIPRLARTWTLLYSLDQDGISLRTLYDKCDLTKRPPPKPASTLLVIRDSDDAIFGAYLSDSKGLKVQESSVLRRHYGSGESFLYTKRSTTSPVRIFKWSGKNDYIALCEPTSVSFGAAGETFGLYLDANLFDGSSGICETFSNEVLCGSGAGGAGTGKKAVEFEVVGVEVWGIGP
ncbi:TLD-domain-containing protein [Flagelloscypha sp. PMI_526]|nr:TLD-domain-containing protein [Flagelloscypha sp. PMI_526]